jgi:hypothetical protein
MQGNQAKHMLGSTAELRRKSVNHVTVLASQVYEKAISDQEQDPWLHVRHPNGPPRCVGADW